MGRIFGLFVLISITVFFRLWFAKTALKLIWIDKRMKTYSILIRIWVYFLCLGTCFAHNIHMLIHQLFGEMSEWERWADNRVFFSEKERKSEREGKRENSGRDREKKKERKRRKNLKNNQKSTKGKKWMKKDTFLEKRATVMIFINKIQKKFSL